MKKIIGVIGILLIVTITIAAILFTAIGTKILISDRIDPVYAGEKTTLSLYSGDDFLVQGTYNVEASSCEYFLIDDQKDSQIRGVKQPEEDIPTGWQCEERYLKQITIRGGEWKVTEAENKITAKFTKTEGAEKSNITVPEDTLYVVWDLFLFWATIGLSLGTIIAVIAGIRNNAKQLMQ